MGGGPRRGRNQGQGRRRAASHVGVDPLMILTLMPLLFLPPSPPSPLLSGALYYSLDHVMPTAFVFNIY